MAPSSSPSSAPSSSPSTTTAAAPSSTARHVTAAGARQCSLSAAQVEEIYAKLELHERRALAEWALAQRGSATLPTSRLAFSDGPCRRCGPSARLTAPVHACSTRPPRPLTPPRPRLARAGCRERGAPDAVAGAHARHGPLGSVPLAEHPLPRRAGDRHGRKHLQDGDACPPPRRRADGVPQRPLRALRRRPRGGRARAAQGARSLCPLPEPAR